MSRLFIICLIIVCVFLSACSEIDMLDNGPNGTPPTSTPAPWEPKEGDENLLRGEVFLDETEIIILDVEPAQIVLRFSGELPTPCHNLRAVVSQPDSSNRINVEVYSLSKPEEICIQVIEPFDIEIPLGTFASGEYQVVVNGQRIGEVIP